MLSSFALEGKVTPKGTACATAPNGWHLTNVAGVCIHCGKATR